MPVQLKGHLFQGFMEVFKYKRALYGSSLFGILCGIMPGVGEFLAQQLSYFIDRPISAIMVGAMVLLIGFTIRGALKSKSKREDWQNNDR